ncbi:hypothetical protein GCM10028806_50650 [Spirosoma terrae]|uniref:META domain-containing protein n=1 Tax=Spirosoma terrae TaxID=1968276 RepID=A0A6L9L3C2_9BACT|nr:META domain-containing protein [Spirosoma terrae]NDU93273.1 META domain-containing protein [Spirosoma terrae]
MLNYRVISLALLLFALFAGCGKRNREVAPALANLIGTWQLADSDSSYAVTLEFAYDDRNPPIDITPFLASGKSSVNQYSARMFATIDGTMQINELANTEIAGTSAAMQFEANYFAKLRSVVRFEETSSNELRLFHGGSTPGSLLFKKK